MNVPAITAIGVGIPARNEEARIIACVESVLAAAANIDLPVALVVAADRCTDTTVVRAQRAIERCASHARMTGTVQAASYGSAGSARAAGMNCALGAALRAMAHPAAERCWLATTDADTTVAENWLHTQLRWAQGGAHGVTGLVDVDWENGPAAVGESYAASIARLGRTYGHGHVHGANLGVRADWWVKVGGCGSASVGEDHELWRRLRAAGAELHAVDDVRVRTSGRLVGRAPRGLSHYLTQLISAGAPAG